MPSVCYISIYIIQNGFYSYLVLILLHCIRNLLAYVAALFVAGFSNCPIYVALMRRQGTPNLLVVQWNQPLQNYHISRLIFTFFSLIELLFCCFLSVVCEAQLHICVSNWVNYI